MEGCIGNKGKYYERKMYGNGELKRGKRRVEMHTLELKEEV